MLEMLSECQTTWIWTRRLIRTQAVCIWHCSRAWQSKVLVHIYSCHVDHIENWSFTKYVIHLKKSRYYYYYFISLSTRITERTENRFLQSTLGKSRAT